MREAPTCVSEDVLLDWQQQVDEVQALEAIYADAFRVLDASGVRRTGDGTGPASGGASGSGDGERGGAAERVDAASLASVDAPCSPAWALHCSLLVPVEPPGGSLRLQLPDPAQQAGGDARTDGACAEHGGRGAAAAGAVRRLPPICLQLRLGQGYPSQRAPGVTLSALWLGRHQAAELERQLARLWQEQGPGGPILYTWADWLQSTALEHLGAAEELLLADDGDNDVGGEPGSSGSSVATASGRHQRHSEQPFPGGQPGRPSDEPAEARDSAESRLVKLLRYDAVQEHAAFVAGLHTCGICLEERPGAAFVRLEGCRHAWCADCLGQQARLHVAEGGLEQLRCPHPKCGAPLAPSVLRRLLSTDDFERWEQLTLQRTLDTMPDAAYCPRCSSLALEDEDSCAQCPKCLFVFCSLCCEGWHPGVACVSAETKLAMLRRKMEGGGAAALRELRRQEQELQSLAQIEKMSKRCPRCGMATQKAEGCNKMSCGGCGAYWCWRCGKEIDGYRHFRSGECILFDEAEILRWEAQWEEMEAAARVFAAGVRNELVGETAARRDGRPRGCHCPQCGQVNHKLGNNNMMRCWSCTSHFCYACHTLLRGRGAGGTHFGPSGCRQHSAD